MNAEEIEILLRLLEERYPQTWNSHPNMPVHIRRLRDKLDAMHKEARLGVPRP